MTSPAAADEQADHVELFASLVSGTASELQSIRSDLPLVYERLQLPSVGSYSAAEIYKHLTTQIVAVLTSDQPGWRHDNLAQLRRDVLQRHVLDGAQLQPSFRIAEHLFDILRGVEHIHPLRRCEAWMKAVQLGHDCLAFDFDPAAVQIRNVTRLYNRHVNVATAAKQLRAEGVSLSISDGRVQAAEPELRKVGDLIRREIRRLGGLNVAEAVFPRVRFDAQLERYLFPAKVSTVPKARPPSLPIGYLLNLAIREADSVAVPSLEAAAAQSAWARACALATSLAALYDCERYTIYDVLFTSTDTFVRFVQQFAIWDSGFSLLQLRPSDLASFLRAAFDWVDDQDALANLGWRFATAIRIVELCVEAAKSIRGPLYIATDELRTRLPQDSRDELAAFLAASTHSPSEANAEYLLPTDVTQHTFGFRPFLPSNAGVTLMDFSWCSPAFFEAMASAARTVWGNGIDDKIGLSAERLVLQELAKHGVSVCRGTYRGQDRKVWECDAVALTPDAVIFFELKKKPFTRLARSGSDLDLLVDLSKSLIAAQVQLGRHELHLRKEGKLELQDGATTHTIDLAGREVERVAVTLLDYGTLQDRLVLSNILRMVSSSTMTTRDPAKQTGLDELMAKGAELNRQHLELKVFDGHRADQPFFNCWFLSVPQILVLLDGVTNSIDFWARLRRLRHVTSGRADFYADLADFGVK